MGGTVIKETADFGADLLETDEEEIPLPLKSVEKSPGLTVHTSSLQHNLTNKR